MQTWIYAISAVVGCRLAYHLDGVYYDQRCLYLIYTQPRGVDL